MAVLGSNCRSRKSEYLKDNQQIRYRDVRAQSFDEGWCMNLAKLWTGRLNTEWQLPYMCVLQEPDDEIYSEIYN